MKKLASTFPNMVISLTVITIVAATALAGVYMLTKTQIEDQANQTKIEAQAAVLNGQEGQAIEVEADGFGGKMRVMVGLAADGTILGYEILEHSETPGLGDKAAVWFKDTKKPNQNIIGRKAGNLTVSKDGGEVDAITAATISSRAFLKAINSAAAQVEGCSGATQVDGCAEATTKVETEDHHE
ncbi:MAG: FMN-binding protein [Paludibacteraceae bacterium]|nr:FMN-binding protein [Paludibacteraceae bacterium]